MPRGLLPPRQRLPPPNPAPPMSAKLRSSWIVATRRSGGLAPDDAKAHGSRGSVDRPRGPRVECNRSPAGCAEPEAAGAACAFTPLRLRAFKSRCRTSAFPNPHRLKAVNRVAWTVDEHWMQPVRDILRSSQRSRMVGSSAESGRSCGRRSGAMATARRRNIARLCPLSPSQTESCPTVSGPTASSPCPPLGHTPVHARSLTKPLERCCRTSRNGSRGWTQGISPARTRLGSPKWEKRPASKSEALSLPKRAIAS